jgi:signal peptidase
MNAKTKKVLAIVGNAVLWLFVIFAVLITAMVLSSTNNENGVASFSGKSFINIKTNSMSPTIKAGDMAIVELLTDQQKTQCKVGDVITYYTDLDGNGTQELNTHRVAEVYEENGCVYYKTRGDNGDGDNNQSTEALIDKNPVVFSDVIGKWTGTKLNGMGNVMSFLQSSVGFMCVIVLPLVLFFLFELVRFIRTLLKVKSKGNISIEEKEEIKKRAIEEYLRQQQLEKDSGNKPEDEKPSEKDENSDKADK